MTSSSSTTSSSTPLEVLLPLDDSLPLLVRVGGETICLRDTRGEGRTSGGTVVQWSLIGDLLYIQSGSRIAAFPLNQSLSTMETRLRKLSTSLLSFNTYPELMGYLCSSGRKTVPLRLAGWKKDDLPSVEPNWEQALEKALSLQEPLSKSSRQSSTPDTTPKHTSSESMSSAEMS